MGLTQFFTNKLGLSVACVLLALVVAVQLRDAHRQRTIGRLTTDLEATARERDIYRDYGTRYKSLADSAWFAVRVLDRSNSEYVRLSDSVLVRSTVDLGRARRQSERAQTIIDEMREYVLRDSTVTECADLFQPPSSRLPSFW